MPSKYKDHMVHQRTMPKVTEANVQTSCSWHHILHTKTSYCDQLLTVTTPYIHHPLLLCMLTLKVLVATIDAQWEGMGDVGSARYEPALLPPCPTIRV